MFHQSYQINKCLESAKIMLVNLKDNSARTKRFNTNQSWSLQLHQTEATHSDRSFLNLCIYFFTTWIRLAIKRISAKERKYSLSASLSPLPSPCLNDATSICICLVKQWTYVAIFSQSYKKFWWYISGPVLFIHLFFSFSFLGEGRKERRDGGNEWKKNEQRKKDKQLRGK